MFDFENVEQMAATADAVVLAKVVGESFDSIEPGYELRKLKLEVQEYLSGEAPKGIDLVDYSERNGTELVVNPDLVTLYPGDTAVIFLWRDRTDQALWTPVGAQGIVRVNADNTLEPQTSEANELTATLASMDLADVKAKVEESNARVANGEELALPSPMAVGENIRAGLGETVELQTIEAASRSYVLRVALSGKSGFCYRLAPDDGPLTQCSVLPSKSELESQQPLWFFSISDGLRFVVGLAAADTKSVAVTVSGEKETVATVAVPPAMQLEANYFVHQVPANGNVDVTIR